MFTLAFLLATLERAVKTFAQALAAALIADGTGVLDTHWSAKLSVAGMAGVLSILTSVGSGAIGNDGPSLSAEALTVPTAAAKAAPKRRAPKPKS